MRSADAEQPQGRATNEGARIPVRSAPSASTPEADGAPPEPGLAKDSAEAWRDRALRLQAEMENYRKRQRRLADERIAEERERLLRRFLLVADELERALSVLPADMTGLREGVRLTHRSLMQQLEQEGVERIRAEGQPFDPRWHEAVGSVPQHEPGLQPQTVVEVQRPGYRLGERLLRPARVIVSA